MARLIVQNAEGAAASDATPVELKPGDAVGSGRDADNQIPLPDTRGVSRKHCRITAVPSGGGMAWELTDMGATNKTRVNGKPVDKVILSSGDIIAIGATEIRFEDPKEEARLKEAGQKGVCFLQWVGGDRKGEKVWLDTPRVTIGRRESNTIPIDDRMSSGHHAEVTKDLNGYTVRDLGSTNGTLVNGEPTTEASLSHGTRIRIGNSRFVFKDPSMKDIEVELSQFEEDDGWGMMGDIDLSKARGSYAGLILGLLLVGLAGAAGFVLMQQAEQGATDSAEIEGLDNLVSNGDMEDEEAVRLYWTAQDEDAPVAIQTTKRGKGLALSLRHTGGSEAPQPVLVGYADSFPALPGKGLRVRANVRARGDAALVAVWRNWRDLGEGERAASGAGNARLTSTVSLGSGSIDLVATQPSWAESVVFGVRLGPNGSATLDDLSITRASNAGDPARELDCPGDPKAYLDPSGTLDIVNGMTVLVVGAAPFVTLADGTTLTAFMAGGPAEGQGTGPFTVSGHFSHGDEKVSAKITWARMDNDEGLLAQIECAQAASVGLSARLPRAHLGVSLGVVTSTAGSIQAAAGERLEGIRRTLCGDPIPAPGRPRTLVSFVPQADATGNALSVHDATDSAVLEIRHASKGTSASFYVVTNYDVQLQAAQEAYIDATRLVKTQPGAGVEALREIVAIYPFIESVRDQARALADKADVAARKEIAGYRKALADFRIFRSRDTLVILDELSERMQQRYPSRGATNRELESDVAEITAEADDARVAWYSDNAGTELTRLERLADLLAGVKGYEPMSAIFYRTIIDRFGHLESDDSFGRRVSRAKEKYAELHKQHAAAIPDLPPVDSSAGR